LNFGGTLGNGEFTGASPNPVRVVTDERFRAISAAIGLVCGIASDDRLHCWGGTPAWIHGTPQLLPGDPVGRWRQFSAFGAHGCGVAHDDTGWCWGANDVGQLGDATRAARPVPTQVAGALQFKAISTGTRHSCGLTTTGAAYCWGDNSHGNLGFGTTGRLAPVAVSGGLVFESIDAGVRNTCGITIAASAGGAHAYCWGDNVTGAIGDGTTVRRTVPTLVADPPAGGWALISVGTMHACALTQAGEAYCWGANPDGRLGDGTREDRHSPTRVSGGLRFQSISAGIAHQTGFPGIAHTCGVTVGGDVYCWGGNRGGAVGDGTTENRLAPVRVRIPG
jgi:alpha-tubulin suppressor-like RCC1 family protein